MELGNLGHEHGFLCSRKEVRHGKWGEFSMTVVVSVGRTGVIRLW